MTVVEDATRVIENFAIVTNVNGVTGTVNANLQCNITGNQANCVEAASGTIGGNAAAVNVATTEAAQQTVIEIDNASGGSAPAMMTAADGIPTTITTVVSPTSTSTSTTKSTAMNAHSLPWFTLIISPMLLVLYRFL